MRRREYAREVLPGKGIKYEFHLGELDLNQKLPSNTRQHLYFIFKEAVNNVARHSNANRMKVVFGNFGDACRLEICNNGTVTEKALLRSGLGVSNIQMRAKKLNAKLTISTEEGFSVRLILQKL